MKIVRTSGRAAHAKSPARACAASASVSCRRWARCTRDISRSCATRASECGLVVVSLFVNPTQFNEAADLARYPRDEARDAELAAAAGADMLFAPVRGGGLSAAASRRRSRSPASPSRSRASCAARSISRRGDRRGEAAQHGAARRAFFGQKDAQQALLIRRMVRDLDIPVRSRCVRRCVKPTGSRCRAATRCSMRTSRRRAPALSRALFAVADAVAARRAQRRACARAGTERARERRHRARVLRGGLGRHARARVELIEGETLVPIAARFGACG